MFCDFSYVPFFSLVKVSSEVTCALVSIRFSLILLVRLLVHCPRVLC